jgi:hypothetical protein
MAGGVTGDDLMVRLAPDVTVARLQDVIESGGEANPALS